MSTFIWILGVIALISLLFGWGGGRWIHGPTYGSYGYSGPSWYGPFGYGLGGLIITIFVIYLIAHLLGVTL